MRFATAFERKSTGGMATRLIRAAPNQPAAMVQVIVTHRGDRRDTEDHGRHRSTTVTRVGDAPLSFPCVRVLTPASRVLTQMCAGSLRGGPLRPPQV